MLRDVPGGCTVCTGCGYVAAGSVAFGDEDVYGWVPQPSSPAVYKRSVYMRERLSQWCMTEPPVPQVHMTELRAAFARYGAEKGRDYKAHPLSKREVSALIHLAELGNYNYSEKWLSIRHALTGYANVAPTRELCDFILQRFVHVANVWETHKEIHPRTRNIISINPLTRFLLLMHSQRAYDTHKDDWPLEIKPATAIACFKMFRAICEVLQWTPVVPVVAVTAS